MAVISDKINVRNVKKNILISSLVKFGNLIGFYC